MTTEGADDATRIGSGSGLEPFAAPRQPGSQSVAAGQLLGHTYLIEELLARGGMGEVYRARHTVFSTPHAIKVIRPEMAQDEGIISRFVEEAKKLKRVRNDAVVDYEGFFLDENGLRYLVMEFVDGIPLSTALKERQFTPAEIRQLRDRLALGLGTAHDQGIVHRDMSPDNVILVEGRTDKAKIIDFGIAKSSDPNDQTVVGDNFAGKYSYASPEQLGLYGKVDHRSDIYSLGLVLVAVAQGRSLDMGNSFASMIEARKSVPDLSGVAPELRDELAPLLRPDPVDRPQTMQDLPGLSDAMQRTMYRPSTQYAAPPDKPEPAVAPAASGGNKLVMIGAAAAVFVVVAGAGAYFAMRPGPAAPPAAIASAAAPLQAVMAPPPTPASDTPAPTVSAATTTTMASTTPLAETPPSAVPARPTPASPPQQVAALSGPALVASLKSEVERAISGIDCAQFNTAVASDLSVKVTGFVGSSSDLDRVHDALRTVSGVKRVDEAVDVFPEPQCAFVQLVQPDGKAATGAAVPQLDLNKPSRSYRNGDKLVVTATGSRGRDSYLYVDFIDNEGNVVHMLPTEAASNNHVSSGQKVILGTASNTPMDNEPVYEISAPFGTNMILAIASSKPLFPGPREEQEQADQYLRALSDKLKSGDGGTVAGTYSVITTSQ